MSGGVWYSFTYCRLGCCSRQRAPTNLMNRCQIRPWRTEEVFQWRWFHSKQSEDNERNWDSKFKVRFIHWFMRLLLLLTLASLVVGWVPTAKRSLNLAMGLYGYLRLYSSHRPCSSRSSLAIWPLSRGTLGLTNGRNLFHILTASFVCLFFFAHASFLLDLLLLVHRKNGWNFHDPAAFTSIQSNSWAQFIHRELTHAHLNITWLQLLLRTSWNVSSLKNQRKKKSRNMIRLTYWTRHSDSATMAHTTKDHFIVSALLSTM